MKRQYQICTKCIMDTSDLEITFDEEGICNHCREYRKNLIHLRTEEDLKIEINKIKKEGQGKKYDCIIGLSGGVDSSFVAYLVKKMGLRPLAVHLDNGWDTELSVSNIERIIKVLDIDFYTYVVNWEEFRSLQLSFLRASVANIEIPTDHAIVAILYKKAVELGIRYIIHGGNLKTEGVMPRAWGYDARDLRHLIAIHKKFGGIELKTFPMLGVWKLAYYSLLKRIKWFPILNYGDYDKTKAKELLQKQLGWRDYSEKHEESLFTKFFQSYILPKKFNIDKRKAHYSTLINSGQMTREEATEKMKYQPYPAGKEMQNDKDYVVKKLGLTTEEFDNIMSQPIKSYRDYPNHSLFIERLSFIYRFIKKIAI